MGGGETDLSEIREKNISQQVVAFEWGLCFQELGCVFSMGLWLVQPFQFTGQ